MKYLIIRDDDLSYWTSKDEIEEKYAPFLNKGFRVSFGIISDSVRSYNLGNYDTFYQDFDLQKNINENKELVSFIKDELFKNRIDILVHGHNHTYYFNTCTIKELLPATHENLTLARQNNKKIFFFGEFNNGQITKKMYLDKLQNAISTFKSVFNIEPTVFIPPSNQLCDNALKAIQSYNLNISGLYGKNHLSVYQNILRLYYSKFHKIHYPHIYKNITNQLSYHSLTTASSFDDLVLKLEISNKLNAPFQIATHYWELDYNLLSQLSEICNYAKRIGYIPIKLSQILHK